MLNNEFINTNVFYRWYIYFTGGIYTLYNYFYNVQYKTRNNPKFALIIFVLTSIFIALFVLLLFLYYVDYIIVKNNEFLLNRLNKYVDVFSTSNILELGAWGEDKLISMLNVMGYIEGINFYKNKSFIIDNKNLKPDIVLKLNPNVNLIIDSKMPWITYHKYLTAQDIHNKNKFFVNHVNALKRHINNLSTKEYYKLEKSLPFIIMFIPIETMLSDVTCKNNSVIELCIQHNIFIATPSTICVFICLIRLLIHDSSFSAKLSQCNHDISHMLRHINSFIDVLKSMEVDMKHKSCTIANFREKLQADFVEKLKYLKTLGEDKT